MGRRKPVSKDQQRKTQVLKKRKRKGPKAPSWLPFQKVALSDVLGGYPEEHRPMVEQTMKGAQMFVNNKYQVTVKEVPTGLGPMYQLQINRLDHQPCHDWRELQKVKNTLVGTGAEGVELYPAEDRLVDCNNGVYMYVLGPRKGKDNKPLTDESGCYHFNRFPFGLTTRIVSETPRQGCKQRPWTKDDRPDDLISLTDDAIKASFEAYKEKTRRLAQEAQDAITVVQRAQDPSAALRGLLGYAYGTLEAVSGAGYTARLFDEILDALQQRQDLMTKAEPTDADQEALASVTADVRKWLKIFEDAHQEAAASAPPAAPEATHGPDGHPHQSAPPEVQPQGGEGRAGGDLQA